MVQIQVAADDTPVVTNPLLNEKKKKFRLTRFTSSASLTLSWPFPIIILCFQTNQRRFFDPRIYALLFSAYLVSGFFKRLFLLRFIPPSMLSALSPAIINLIGSGVFVSALYKCNWSVFSLLLMTLSRLIFGWSTYSAADYSHRAEQFSKKVPSKTLQDCVSNLVPDLQDESFQVGVIIALFLCFILETCLHKFGPEFSEFYSMFIISCFSVVLSFVSAPFLHSAVQSLINIQEIPQSVTSTPRREEQQAPPSSSEICHPSRVVALRQQFILSNLFQGLSRRQYPSGQLLVTLFSGLSDASAICVDHLLLPYLLVSTRVNFFNDTAYFPFPELLLLYTFLFSIETGLRYFVLKYSTLGRCLISQSNHVLLGGLLIVSLGLTLTPTLLFAAGESTPSSTALFGFVIFVFCLIEGTMNAGHTIISGLLFTRYCRAIALKDLAQTGEQLVGLTRCFFASLLFLVTGAVLYHQLFMASLVMVIVTHCLALTLGSCVWVGVYAKERALRVRVEEAE